LIKDAAGYWARAYLQLTGQQWEELTVTPFDSASPPACAAQHRRGRPADQLVIDCPNGSWTYDLLHRGTGSTRLSPGDLDEAVAALLGFGQATAGTGPSGFDRIAAYRNGVLKGLSACGG